MKVRASLKKICSDCKFVKRHGRLRIFCVTRRHNQVQG